jgi:hypothetical protein
MFWRQGYRQVAGRAAEIDLSIRPQSAAPKQVAAGGKSPEIAAQMA